MMQYLLNAPLFAVEDREDDDLVLEYTLEDEEEDDEDGEDDEE